MCGIAGILSSQDPNDGQRIAAMTAIQAHRGPDGGRVKNFPGAWFGHRRLSIIDLDQRADQPMISEDHRHVLVFNGELYNYKELRLELVGLGYSFRTDSDSEVLLSALREWGEAVLDRLIGMFAFCFYDVVTRQALLARDAFGQKPLQLAHRADGALLFASEVKGLLAGGIDAAPNKVAWARYLLDARYDDQADSVFAGIEQLLPGELVWVSADGALRRRRWYRLGERVAPRVNIAAPDASEYLQHLLIDAAKLHMRADVPVGLSLSGGFDSSSLLACLDLGGVLPRDFRCLSVDFGGDLSETPWIKAAAQRHGLDSTIISFTPEDFRTTLKSMMWHLEAPIGGLMNCALAPIMALADTGGTRVILDGTGLDEAFGGYRNHHDLYVGLALRDHVPNLEQIIHDYAKNWGVSLEQARNAGKAAMRQSTSAIDGTMPERPELISYEIKSQDRLQTPAIQMGDPLRNALATYLHVEKIPRNTRMKDRLSMAFGVELRLPFLDHRLVEFGLSLPPDLLFMHGRSKSILREAMSGAMDDGVRLARKRSIQAPQGLWLRKEPMRSYITDLIHSTRFAERGFFNVAACRAAFDRFCTGADANSFFVWQWINVEEWFQIFIDQDSTKITYPFSPAPSN